MVGTIDVRWRRREDLRGDDGSDIVTGVTSLIVSSSVRKHHDVGASAHINSGPVCVGRKLPVGCVITPPNSLLHSV